MKLENENRESRTKGVIEEDPGVGFYLYIYDLETGACIEDQLQDSLEIAKQQAAEDFGMPLGGWKPV